MARTPDPLLAQTGLTPAQRHIRASIAALARWSREDPAANAARGQAGLRARFEREAREADPHAPDDEIARRAECAYRAHFKRLAFEREKNRATRKAGGDAA